MDGDLELNTLRRFSKSSRRLILEEHGSCEVPAGCGGVVLRWLDAAREIPVLFRLYTPGKASLVLDGQPLVSSCPLVSFGTHELRLHLADLPGQGGALVMTAARNFQTRYPRGGTPELLFWTEADSAWEGRRDESSPWVPLQVMAMPEQSSWVLNSLKMTPALCLGLPESPKEMWVRRAFELTP